MADPPVSATPLMKNPPATFTDPEVVLPVVAAPTVRMLLESVEPPIEFEVVDVVVTFPVTASVDPLNVKLEFATAAFEDVDDAVVST